MRQLVLMMCKTNLHDSNYCDNVFNSPGAGPRDNTDQRWHCMSRAMRDSYGAYVGPGVTDLSTPLSATVCLSGVC